MKKSQSEPQARSAENLLSRREFAALSVAAGLAATSGAAMAAAPVAERPVAIETPDGTCDAVLAYPKDQRPAPAVILWPDALGLRPVKVAMAKRLAAEGYAVLAVNQFYRVRKAPVFPPTFDFDNPADRAELMTLIPALDRAAVTRDAKAFIAFLDAQPEVDVKARIGSVGFCMGGKMTIWTAAVARDRVGAGVSFHGGQLVTDTADSPHTLIAASPAAYHFGIAADDDEKEPQAKAALKQALEAAGKPASVEVYPGTKHGWTVPDSKTYNPEQAERAWAAMLALYKQALV